MQITYRLRLWLARLLLGPEIKKWEDWNERLLSQRKYGAISPYNAGRLEEIRDVLIDVGIPHY